MASPTTKGAVLNLVAPPSIAKASGGFSTMRQLGGVFGVVILVAVSGRVAGRVTSGV